jgi:2'-5' RNA ligase
VARSVRMRATVPVESITLFESTLAPAGAPYRRVHAAPLGGR